MNSRTIANIILFIVAVVGCAMILGIVFILPVPIKIMR
jgi:hypothetical protein